MPGTMWAVQKATCSVSAKKLSGLRFSTSLPTASTGTSSSGTSLVASSTSNVKPSACSSVKICTPSSYSGYAPASIASQRSRRWKSGSAPEILTASSHTSECVPAAGDQWNLTKRDSPCRVHQPEGVHAEALHGPVAARDGAVGHRPHQHRGDFGHQRREVPERVVGGPGLRHREVRLGLGGMDEVRELHRVLDEEDGNVVADQVPVPFVGVELDGESANVARGVGGAALAEHRREPHEDRRLLACLGEHRGAGDVGQRLVTLEVAVRRRPARVDDPLGNALVVEMGDLLAEDEVLEQRRPAQAGLERVLVVADRHALIGRQRPLAGVDPNPIERGDRLVRADRRRSAAYLLRGIRFSDGARADDRIRRRGRHADRRGGRRRRVIFRRLVRVERKGRCELLRTRDFGRHVVVRRRGSGLGRAAHRRPAGADRVGRLLGGLIRTFRFRHI